MGKQSSMFQPLPQGSYEDESMDNVISRDSGIIQDCLELIESISFFKNPTQAERKGRKITPSLFISLFKKVNHLADLIERLENCIDYVESNIIEKWDTLSEEQNQFFRESQVRLSDLQDLIHENRLPLRILLIFPSVIRRKNLFSIFEDVIYRFSGAISTAGRRRGLKQAQNGEARYLGSFAEFIDS